MDSLEGFFAYDELTHEPLAGLGWSVDAIPWRRPDVDWDQFDAVVIRSPWDYQKDPGLFLETLARIERSGARLENSLARVRWNLQKTYLKEIASKGVPTVPTLWLSGLADRSIADLCLELGSDEIVVKPIVGANADDTFRLASASEGDVALAMACFRDRDLMVQPFLREIVERGEYSLFYFGGEYSHAVLKKPKPGDFRVQEEHGGAICPVTPEPDLLAAGRRVMDSLGETLLYARVDLVRLPGGEPALMELELIEPSLYFSYDAESPKRFARALDRLFR